jgi:hypothetical protein
MNSFIQFLTQNFGLPDGGLYSNLIASAILGGGAFLYGRAFERRAEANNERRHRELKAHITATHKGK